MTKAVILAFWGNLAGSLALSFLLGNLPWVIIVVLSLLIAFSAGGLIGAIHHGQDSSVYHTRRSKEAKLIWATGFLLAIVISFLIWGPAYILETIPFWIVDVLMALASFIWYDWRYKVGWFKHKHPLDQAMRPYVGKAPPGWVGQVAERGWNGYGVQEGKLTKQEGLVGKALSSLGKML